LTFFRIFLKSKSVVVIFEGKKFGEIVINFSEATESVQQQIDRTLLHFFSTPADRTW